MFRIRSSLVLLSFSVYQFFRDPLGFRNKVAAKFGKRAAAPTSYSSVEQMEWSGEYSDAVASHMGKTTFPFGRLRDRKAKRRSQIQLDWFNQRIEPGRSGNNESDLNRIEVLYFLGNSLPYTNSGYSKRSQAILQALTKTGVSATGHTRLGYPAVIGGLAREEYESVNQVTYRRMMPTIFPRTVKGEVERAVKSLVEQASEQGASLIHTTTGFPNAVVTSQAAQQLGIPWIYEQRGELQKTWLAQRASNGLERGESSEHFVRWSEKELEAARAASGVVVLSQVSKDILLAQGIPSTKICIAPNAAEDELFDAKITSAEAREITGVNGDFVVGTLSAIVPYEGLQAIVEALPRLPPRFTAVIVGDGVELPALKDLAKELGVEARVRFVGKVPQDEVVPWYKSLDIFVVPRLDCPVCRTVTPVKPLAAMALGIPVVASDLPALREVTGNLAEYFEPGNIDAFVTSLDRVASGKYPVEEARNWAKNRTWSRVGYILKEFYTSVLQNDLES